ncbi:TOP6B [Scenedesmus sp. PABB004]|nr:TOP6B [Scenedesmus sp. PABB004]
MSGKAGKGPGPDKLQQKSPAEFFAENKNIAGFDNPGKCLYTTIRELVENALDSAESISELPMIEITIEEVSKARLNALRGVCAVERVDAELYHDYESEEAKKKRLAKEARERERLEKLAAKKGDAAAAASAAAAAAKAADAGAGKRGAPRGVNFYTVTVKDNGAGMPHADIPLMLGRVLSGTKYGVKQTRGKFGLGAKMALIWSKMTTGLPFTITSATRGSGFVSRYELDIDIHKNAPNVHAEARLPNPEAWHGAALSVTIEGGWSSYRAKVLTYLRQIAVITPYAQFSFRYVAEDPKASLALEFRRRTDVMPPPPQATKHHPSSVDLELVKRLIADSRAGSLAAFLTREFDQVNKALAGRLVSELRAGVSAGTDPKSLTSQQVVRLHQLLHEVRFADPSGGHLSPAGEYNLRLGVMKELGPDLIATHAGDVRVFEGHAFLVEAAVSLGGRLRPGLNVYRFANRIPLLFEAGSDVVTRTAAKRVNWGAYKINQATDKVGVFVSIISTKVPFKGAGKEYIGDDVPEMVGGVKAAIQACAAQLRVKIARVQAAREQAARKRNLTRYIPDAAGAVWGVLEKMAAAPPRGPKRARVAGGAALLAQVGAGAVSRGALEAALGAHVERIDTDMALEYQVSQGLAGGAAKTQLWLGAAGPRTSYGPELHANATHSRAPANDPAAHGRPQPAHQSWGTPAAMRPGTAAAALLALALAVALGAAPAAGGGSHGGDVPDNPALRGPQFRFGWVPITFDSDTKQQIDPITRQPKEMNYRCAKACDAVNMRAVATDDGKPLCYFNRTRALGAPYSIVGTWYEGERGNGWESTCRGRAEDGTPTTQNVFEWNPKSLSYQPGYFCGCCGCIANCDGASRVDNSSRTLGCDGAYVLQPDPNACPKSRAIFPVCVGKTASQGQQWGTLGRDDDCATWSSLNAEDPLYISNNKAPADKPAAASARSTPSCCAERNLLNAWIAKARRANVPRHQVVHWVRRKAGTEITVWRHLADGSLGCSVPCVVCKGVLALFDLRVTCLVGPGEWFSGRLTDKDAPRAKPTSRQSRFVFKASRRDAPPEAAAAQRQAACA